MSSSEFHYGPYRLVPLDILNQEEKGSLTPTSHFHGIVHNETGVFLVFNANRGALLEIPPPPLSSPDGGLFVTTWTSPSKLHLACAPLYPVYDVPLLRGLKVSLSSLLMQSKSSDLKTCWALPSSLIKQWTSLEGLLTTVVDCLSSQASRLYPDRYRGGGPCRPIVYGYTSSYSQREQLITAASRSRNAFVPLLAFIAMHFLLLDGSPQSNDWRPVLRKAANLEYRSMDRLEEAVEGVLKCPAGMIVDLADSGTRDMDWLFSLLINGKVKIHVPLYFFLGEDGESSYNRTTWLEDYPFMRYIAARVGDAVRKTTTLPPSPVLMTEYVFIKSTFRRWGVLPNPEHFTTVEHEHQYPPVELHSGQEERQSYIEFFARREQRNKAKLAVETAQKRQTRLSREEAAKKQHCPSSKKGARVFIWEKTNDFWVRKLLHRKEVEDEWDNFTPSQRVFDPFTNEWDLCQPLDPEAVVLYNDYDDGYDSPTYFNDDYDSKLPEGLPAQVQSTLNDPSAALQLVDTYYGGDDDDDDDDGDYRNTSPDNITASVSAKDTFLYRAGFVDVPGTNFSDEQMARVEICARFVGDKTQTAAALGDAARALVHALRTAKKVQDMPPKLFDLCDQDVVNDIWKNAGIAVEVFENLSEQKHRSTAYIVKPRSVSSTAQRQALVFSPATAMQLARLQCESWSEIISQLHELGAPFHIIVEETSSGPSSHQPSLFRCRSLGVRPEEYTPDKYDLRYYWHLCRRFLLSPRGRLALQAGGIVARLARMVIEDSRLELLAEDVDVETAEGCVKNGPTSIFYHCLTREEEDLVLGVYSIKMNQLNPVDPSGHQEKRVSWWPQAGAFFNSDMNIGWWSPDCETWFQGILREMEENKAVVLNNTRWNKRIRGYNAVLRASKNLDAVCADFLDGQSTLQ